MKRIILIILIGIFTGCSSISKEQLILNNNLKLIKKTYPKSIVTQHRYFSYVFNVKDSVSNFMVIVSNKGQIKKTKSLDYE